MNAIEKPVKPLLSRVRKTSEQNAYEAQKLLFTVVVNNSRQLKKEQVDKINQEIDKGTTPELIGLPPQPKEYLRYSDYDCL